MATSTPLKTVAAAAATALGVGALAMLVTGSAASAAQVSASPTYACHSGILGDANYTGTVVLDLPTSVVAGSIVPSRSVSISVVIPDATVDQMRDLFVTSISGTATGMEARFGALKVGVADATIPSTPLPADGDMTIQTTTSVDSFTAPAVPGLYDVKVPTSLTINAVAQSIVPISDTITCTVVPGPSELLGTVTVTGSPNPTATATSTATPGPSPSATAPAKVTSTVTAKLKKKPVTTKKRAKLLVTVTAAGTTPTGVVTAKEGTKTLATGSLTAGAVTLKLSKLRKGKHVVSVVYAGAGNVAGSNTTVNFKVKKG